MRQTGKTGVCCGVPRLIRVGVALVATTAACTPGINYPRLEGPRYTGGPPQLLAASHIAAGPDLRFVTFNVKYGEQVDSAITVLKTTPELQAPDVVALQEVDAAGTQRVAAALGMEYVYYPATFHPKYERDFGNAILSRWPIVGDQKLILPHVGRFRHTARIAVAANLLVNHDTVRVYSAHLGTMAEITPRDKREQAAVILTDAAKHSTVAILGDMNSYSIGTAFRAAGFAWATEHNPRTFAIGRWDHIFLKGLSLVRQGATGVVRQIRGASDHRPVWAEVGHP